MEEKPLILVTNDDSYRAPGIRALIEAVKPFGEVVVVAPDKPQSGMGHAITVGNILRLSKIDAFEGIEAYACTGTPVDCVKLAITDVLKRRPALLVSGINHGANHSINVLYSGTMSAAVEGAMEGIPSIGFSLCAFEWEASMEEAITYARKIVAAALRGEFPPKLCLNVNFPKSSHVPYAGIKICRQAEAYWADSYEKRQDPMGGHYYWLTGMFEGRDKGTDTDVWAIENNYVSVVPVQFDMTAHHAIAHLNTWQYD
ncbi:MAG TPA: 5'/3'-nucleotidase SurE [Luteibaculaceae bacterium]|jgi:5'-nucleotidase|nr:5'/3'-nucleotidase SurE [Luteibaculaceae bacterium]